MILIILNISLICILLVICFFILYKQTKIEKDSTRFDVLLQNLQQGFQQFSFAQEQKAMTLQELLNRFHQDFADKQLVLHEKMSQGTIHGLTILQESVHKYMQESRTQIATSLNEHANLLNQQLNKLTLEVHERLREISGQVEKRLADGFEKTTSTFADILKRLALIDEAQKKITELSSNVVSLQTILGDKRSRGAFGEVQLSALVRNILPENVISFQHALSNGMRVDCILFLPAPTGNISIDAKFPLESFRKLIDNQLSKNEREIFEKQFRLDVRKHINDIAEKYIIPQNNETADGAIMFIPAESIFAEIHSYYPELVEEAFKKRVWLTSPTTLMAILTTVRAVLKDEDTRNQVNIIQEHLNYLAQDFTRFQERMDKLTKHISQANQDAQDVHKSAKKITSRFQKIEKVEISSKELELLASEE